MRFGTHAVVRSGLLSGSLRRCGALRLKHRYAQEAAAQKAEDTAKAWRLAKVVKECNSNGTLDLETLCNKNDRPYWQQLFSSVLAERLERVCVKKLKLGYNGSVFGDWFPDGPIPGVTEGLEELSLFLSAFKGSTTPNCAST